MRGLALLLAASPALAEPLDPAPWRAAFETGAPGDAARACLEREGPKGGSRAELACLEMETALCDEAMSAALVALRRWAIMEDQSRASVEGLSAVQLDAALSVAQSHWRATMRAECDWRYLRAVGGMAGSLSAGRRALEAVAARAGALTSLAEEGA